MKAFLAVPIELFALVGVVVTGLAVFFYGENPKSHFDSYEELEASGLIARGWLPAFLPRSITDTSESHDMDTNSVYEADENEI